MDLLFLLVKLSYMGCGRAHIGKFFSDLGAKVTVCDGRKEHIDYVKQNYPEIKAKVVDLDIDFPSEPYDVIIDMGVMYHLKDCIIHLKEICKLCTWLIVETEIKDSFDENDMEKRREDSNQYDQSLNGGAMKPTIGMIEGVLKKIKFYMYRIDDNRCNSANHNYNWIPTNSQKKDTGLRKMWFCRKDSK